MYRDRADAGRRLAQLCRRFAGTGPVVLGLPRGGVVVAAEVARALDAELDIVVVRKLGAPQQPELAIGAVSSADGPRVILEEHLVRRLNVSEAYLEREIDEQFAELRRREEAYRAGAAPLEVRGRVVIVVDDGVATGASTRAALRAVRGRRPALLVLAVPVAAPESLHMLRAECDEVVCPLTPEPFHAVGAFYDNFDQTTDGEVIDLLTEARHGPRTAAPPPRAGSHP
jgi:putative phosphoribosyl transferase